MPRRCFVISPIGAPGSDVRDHADDVFDFIIKPAMEEVGMAVYRADHDQKVGRITDQMFESILTDDLCVAVLSFQNPNVYYELAVAQCAARPVIILNEKGNSLPFDLKDLRVIEYTLRPRMVFDKVYVKQIVDMVRNLEALNWVVPVPFGSGLSPLGRERSDFTYRGRMEALGQTDNWLTVIDTACGALDFLGIHLRYWTKMPHFRRTIEAKAEGGCRIRFLVMHPDNPAYPQYINPDVNLPTRQAVVEMADTTAYLREVAAGHPNVQVREISRGAHHQQMVRIDDQLFVTLVLYSESSRRFPLLECTSESAFFRVMLNEYETLWNLNTDSAPN